VLLTGCNRRPATHAELDVDGEVGEVRANLLLDSLSSALVGGKVDVGLDGSGLLAAKCSLEDKLSELGSGFASA
jgi:hypothetical protein